jgi:hypothetical protein
MTRRPLAALTALGLVALLGGCYHATVTTGATPSSEVIQKGSASGWVFGLIPPSTIETASKCANGVAQVETQLSFVNQLVRMLTLGIYTPMTIKVTCAAAANAAVTGTGTDLHVSATAPADEIRAVLIQAAEVSRSTGEPVVVSVE